MANRSAKIDQKADLIWTIADKLTGVYKQHAVLSILLCFVFIFSFFMASVEAAASGQKAPSFQIDFIDVGQGDAALVQCDGHYMLVDGGNSKKSDLIYSYLKQRQITYLDYIVATHADADHVGGLAGALNYAKAGKAFCTVLDHDTKAFKSFVKYLSKQGKSIMVPTCGQSFSLGGASITVVGPVKMSSDSNNNSIVLRIVYGNTSFLLTGDAEEAEEKDIIRNTPGIQSTVLKVAHHGSDASTSSQFLKSVAPKYAVISVGADNTYGHPAENTLSSLRAAGVQTFRTDIQGHIICTSDGKKVSFQPQKNPEADIISNDAPERSMPDQSDVSAPAQSTGAQTYILNTNTHKFHYPNCSSVSDMKEKNKKVFTGTRDEAIAQGYVPCKRCKP